MTGAAAAPALSPAAQSARIARAVRGSFRAFFEIEHLGGDYVYGRHTAAIIEACEGVVRDVEAGRSRYLIINLPFRHGKSDISSRALPAWWLLRNPDAEVMLGAYGATLAEGFARDARAAFERWAPHYGLGIDKGSRAVDNWRIAAHRGGMRSVGLQGGAVGHGFKLGVIDDFYKSRLEAESPVIRNRVWDGFQADFLTRRAPISGLIIVAHRQHTHDLCARIIGASTPGHEDYNVAFPRFDVLKFPAQSPEYAGPDNPEGWLFPERWSADYYESQRAMMSPYLWSALALQSPTVRAGNVFTLANVAEWDEATPPPDGLRWAWGWDLASTEEQRLGLKSGDPDYTCGVLAAWEPGRAATDAGTIWIRRVVRGRWAAAERERVMIREIERTPEASVYVEVVAGYRDAYTRLRELLPHRNVLPITPTRDKLTRAERAEAVFAHGRVRLAPGEAWQDRFLDEVGAFPSAPHDDQVDAMVLALDDALTKRAGERVLDLDSQRGDTLTLAPGTFKMLPALVWAKDSAAPLRNVTGIDYFIADTRLPPEVWRLGVVHRAWAMSLAGPSAMALVHIDDKGNWTVWRSIQAKFASLEDAWMAGRLQGMHDGLGMIRLSRDVFTSVDDEDYAYRARRVFQDCERRAGQGGSVLNAWVEPEALTGGQGIERIQGLIAAGERRKEPLMVFAPEARPAFDALEVMRFKPGRDDFGAGDEGARRLAGDGGPIVRALRALAIELS